MVYGPHTRKKSRKIIVKGELFQKIEQKRMDTTDYSTLPADWRGRWKDALADLGFLERGDFGNPSERSERALSGLGLRENEIWAFVSQDLAPGGAQNDIEIT